MPLTESAIAAIVAHMNEDHADAILGYVDRFGSRTGAEAATIVSLDAAGMVIRATSNGTSDIVRIEFDHDLRDADDARDTLIAMARES